MSKECGCGPVGENEIARYVRDAVNEYFRDLEGEHPSSSIYDMVVRCVEKPLIETVLHHASGNQTKTAELLGINRNTLRKKMQELKIK
jgi:Fis family transcriptional regulator